MTNENVGVIDTSKFAVSFKPGSDPKHLNPLTHLIFISLGEGDRYGDQRVAVSSKSPSPVPPNTINSVPPSGLDERDLPGRLESGSWIDCLEPLRGINRITVRVGDRKITPPLF